MTPKEKADELMAKFMAIKSTKLSDFSVIYSPVAKLCALIAVDEISWILNEISYNADIDSEMYFYNKVKQEIEKL
jgi:hypothetical protein